MGDMVKSLGRVILVLAFVNAAVAAGAIYCLETGAFFSVPRASAKMLDSVVADVKRLPPERALEILSANLQLSKNLACGLGNLANKVAESTLTLALLNTAVLTLIWVGTTRLGRNKK
jgi:pyruvate-formate lyase-activating enzyme